ncbi:hypothetical protein EV127DRAFT_45654 [Xylaria flabelliformis]|nr:hypothetical protein EV127DRAFT_45654 [Xylaria flabelliformis]
MQPTITSNKASRRRAQNASAQRAYRAKQKQKMQRLEALTIAALTSSGPLTEGYIDTSRAQEQGGFEVLQPLTTAPSAQTGALISATDLNPSLQWYGPAPTIEADVSFSRVHALLDACTPRERQTFHVIVMRERFGLRDMIKYGLIQLGYALDPWIFDRARHASSRAWLAEVLAVVGPDVDILAVLGAGIKLLASLSLPETDGEENVVEEEVLRRVVFARQPDILSNQITLTTVALGSAFFANAFLLGIPLSAMVEDEDREMSAQALACTKPDLQPTPAQLAVPHHPSFDVIPWPEFRANICRALAHDPPLIDDGELCLDFMNDGMRCWGSNAGDSLAGRGQGAPWDSRSWEAAPWFLEKWEFLTDGRDGQMWRNSEWWRAMRG